MEWLDGVARRRARDNTVFGRPVKTAVFRCVGQPPPVLPLAVSALAAVRVGARTRARGFSPSTIADETLDFHASSTSSFLEPPKGWKGGGVGPDAVTPSIYTVTRRG